MIPLTPPTDNLYKFISLFGLTIFLFTLYNLSQVYDAANLNEMGMQDIKMKFQKEILMTYEEAQKMNGGEDKIHLRPLYLKKIREELHGLTVLIEESDLSLTQKIELQSEITKLEINLSLLNKKIYTCYILASLGIGLMIFGFIRWKKREQDFRDKLLRYEFENKSGNSAKNK